MKADPIRPGRRRRTIGLAAAAAAAAVVGLFAVMSLPESGSVTPTDEPTLDQDAQVLSVPTPADLAIARTDATSATASWVVADAQPGDFFQWHRIDPAAEGARGITSQPQLKMVGLPPGARPCLEVWLVRNGIPSDAPASGCEA